MEVIGIVALVGVWIALTVFESGKAQEASDPATASLGGRSLSDLDVLLRTSGWVRNGDWAEGDGVRRAIFKRSSKLDTLTADFRLRAEVTDERVSLHLDNGGTTSRTMLFGFIPMGPRVPVGASQFIKAKRALDAQW